MIHKLKAINQKMDLKSKFYPKYVFYKPIFISYLLFLFVLVGIIAYGYGFQDYTYISCPLDAGLGGCYNQLYQPFYTEGIYSIEYLDAGQTIGIEPPIIIEQFHKIVVLTTLLAFMLNHLIFNMALKKND